MLLLPCRRRILLPRKGDQDGEEQQEDADEDEEAVLVQEVCRICDELGHVGGVTRLLKNESRDCRRRDGLWEGR